jgi:pyruvate,orthophosphate dikinase
MQDLRMTDASAEKWVERISPDGRTGALPRNGDGSSDRGTKPKARIVGELGEQELLLPALVNEALAANDRAKYLMTLLQVAREHADRPAKAATDLKSERIACGLADAELDGAVRRSRKDGPDIYVVPGAGRIHDLLVSDVRRMLAPLCARAPTPPGAEGKGDGDQLAASYEERLRPLLSQAPSLADDRISGGYISRLTAAQRGAGDSVHLLVMDLHKELNRLQQQLATEAIDGARVYGVREEDRPLVAAFMAGLNQTREVKFDHPGLGTTATRAGERLVLQNDIGLTEAHVLVIHVERQQVTLTYTDVHIERLVFFQNLFDRFTVRWQDTVSRRAAGLREDLYHLCVGTYGARDHADLLAYLAFLGSRLVFLIDWNRARKRLRKFAPRRVCLEVLRWAADHNYGHRGFLALGGDQLVFDALQTAGRLPLPPGGQLSDVLGPERTAEFLKFTLQTACEGLKAGRSEFLIRDEVSAELRQYIDTVHQRLLEVAAEHAPLVVELALAARDLLLAAGPALDQGLLQRTVLRAHKWEHRADEVVNRCRTARRRGDAPRPGPRPTDRRRRQCGRAGGNHRLDESAAGRRSDRDDRPAERPGGPGVAGGAGVPQGRGERPPPAPRQPARARRGLSGGSGPDSDSRTSDRRSSPPGPGWCLHLRRRLQAVAPDQRHRRPTGGGRRRAAAVGSGLARLRLRGGPEALRAGGSMASPNPPADLYLFGCGAASPPGATAAVVGNKAANLIRMAEAGLPVPPGFVLPTALCRAYFHGGQQLPESTAEFLRQGSREVEKATRLTFGGDRRPLLVAVRSGAPVSMPGMLDTLLNVGLCDRTLPALVRMTGNPRHAWDSYRRLIQAYAEIAAGLPADPFERILGEHLRQEAVEAVGELDVAALKSVVREFLAQYKAERGEPFPQDPVGQLTGAIEAVFRSWQCPRAVEYRRLHGLDDLPGTAVTVQVMVFGNMGATSGSGVGFTRDPATGANELYLDFLPNAQGEDVVSGRCPAQGPTDFGESHPHLYRQLRQVKSQLELLFRDAQDFEFTVQEGQLYLLQTRRAKRTAWAALRSTCEQVAEGLIDEATALDRLAGYELSSICTARLATAEGCRPVGTGIPASPGVAVGEAVLDPDRAVKLAEAGRSPILIRTDISPADIAGLAASAGVLTARGGRTAHAAVVARHLNKVCIVGCRDLAFQGEGKTCRIGDLPLEEGTPVSLDGHSGRVYLEKLEVVVERPTQYLQEVERWKRRRASTS